MLAFSTLALVLMIFTHISIYHAQGIVNLTVSRVYAWSLSGTITDSTYYELRDVLNSLPPGSVLIIYMQTPGGLLDAALNIVELFETSGVITVGYVYPQGSYAWSGGTLVLLSTTVAAMAPGTVIGSCQPVEVNPITGQEVFINESKILNAVAKYFGEAASFRGRNVTFAEDCVYLNVNLGPYEALKYGVVNYVASTPYQLLSLMNGTVVKQGGVEYRLVFVNPTIEEIPEPLNYQLYNALQNPTIDEVLEFLGVVLILVGLVTAHIYLAGLGALLMIIVALLGLPLNYLGIALMALGAVFIAIEWHAGGKLHGVLIAIGAIIMAIGIMLLIPMLPAPQYMVKYTPLELTAVLYAEVSAILALSGWLIAIIARAIRAKPISHIMFYPTPGLMGVALEDIKAGQMGIVKIRGEYWRAIALEDVKYGDSVVVVSYRGGIVEVKKVSQ